ncbi:MAG TPA: ABC transporter permease [Caldilineae bacterium]|nr:ABC transporter permease [Caldilineae bacterium]
MLTRTLSITRKEFLHIVRDPRTLAIMFLLPIMQLVLLGYAATSDVGHVIMAVLDWDQSSESRALIDAYRATDYFVPRYFPKNETELRELMDAGKVRVGLIIPAGYGRNLTRHGTAQVGFVIDGSDPSVANTAYAAAQSVGQSIALKLIEERMGGMAVRGPEVRTRVWYNPELKSSNFMIPGLIGMILQTLAILLTALALVREREKGTIEQLIVTPLRAPELIVGKIIPYVLVALFDLGEVLLIGTLWFKVPINGSILLLLELSLLFLLTCLGIGLMISSSAQTQQEAMFLTFFTLVPSIFLSGFFFPLDAMPAFLQAVSYVVPLRYFLIIVRSVIIKGVGIEALREPVLALCIFAPITLTLAILRVRKQTI